MKKIKLRRIFNKKAVSPMIATVLLVAFVVSIGALVMNWAKSYVEETTRFAADKSNREVQCSLDVQIDLVTLDDLEQICYDSSTGELYFMLENGPTTDLDHLEARIIRSDKTSKLETISDSALSKSEAKAFNIYYSNISQGEDPVITEVRIMPAIIPPGTSQIVLCSNGALIRQGSEIASCDEI